MKAKRGDVVLAVFPFATGTTAKKRPVLVIQADTYNQRMHNAVVAEITSNTQRANDPAHLFIDITTADGQTTGLIRDSLISCVNLATLHESRCEKIIGHLSSSLMAQVEQCLKAALELS